MYILGAGNVDDRRFRYLICRHEVKEWIDKNGIDELIRLIEKVDAGQVFCELYYNEIQYEQFRICEVRCDAKGKTYNY